MDLLGGGEGAGGGRGHTQPSLGQERGVLFFMIKQKNIRGKIRCSNCRSIPDGNFFESVHTEFFYLFYSLESIIERYKKEFIEQGLSLGNPFSRVRDRRYCSAVISKELDWVPKYHTRLDLVAQLAEHWTSKPKIAGLIPTVVRQIFQLARCGYTLRVTPQTHSTTEYVTT